MQMKKLKFLKKILMK